ncbi:hypothetical protein ACIRYZ_02330 [Kitasatospora sp. NPDC101155]|uniref:hypothetical protein n=1 Tax=Kitasatospora sp. NPDC101155 TaxID=3364097 RepID=UPI0037F69B82
MSLIVTYVHATPESTVTGKRQADGCPVLTLAIATGEVDIFGPSPKFDGPAAHLAFAEALASAAHRFLELARDYAAGAQPWQLDRPGGVEPENVPDVVAEADTARSL